MEKIQKTLASLPNEPGVYLYHDAKDNVIYVGKAINLYRRVKQYFQNKNSLSDKTKRLVPEISRIEIVPTTSEFDALLLEAKLIRSHKPKYNVISRDDKSPLYVAITLSEKLPHIRFIRKGEISLATNNKQNIVYGPFQSAHALKTLLRQVRRAVPYCMKNKRNGKPCFYTHIGLCNPCPSEIESFSKKAKKEAIKTYRKNIYRLKAIFDGKAKSVLKEYEKDMNNHAKALRIEEAKVYKKRIETLYSISAHRYDPAIFLERGADDVYEEELAELLAVLSVHFPKLTSLSRIECFDMSQLFGDSAVGSMVVLTNGRPDNSQYRKFRIRTSAQISDTGMMSEVLTRRMKHTDWSMPQFLLVDGGKPQVSIAKRVLHVHNLDIPCAGLAKRREELILANGNKYKAIRLPMSGKAIKVLKRIRDEAHRFAISYHRNLRNKALVSV